MKKIIFKLLLFIMFIFPLSTVTAGTAIFTGNAGAFIFTCDGDLNYDGFVNFADLAILKKDFGRTDCPTDCNTFSADSCKGDINQDGNVDQEDLEIMKNEFFSEPADCVICADK